MFVSHLPQSSNCSSKQIYRPGLQVHHPLFQKIDWHPQVYCLKHCHVQKDQKDIILRDWEIPPGPQDSNQSKNPSDLGCFSVDESTISKMPPFDS